MPEGVIELELCAPEREPLNFEVKEVIIPGAAGVFTVQNEHTPLLSTLTTGVLIAYFADGKEEHISINGGFAEVLDNRVIVLTDTMEEGDEIDLARAEEAKERAERHLSKPGENTDILRAEAAMRRAMTRVLAKSREGY